jgi:diguanylate cyclase (GGDEF)-like protein
MRQSLRDKRKLILLTSILLSVGFLATSLASYYVSKSAIRSSIVDNELPITADNVYSEIQKDLIPPVLVSSMMASDTFLRDWVIRGERDVREITRYLATIQKRFNAVTSFFVSDRSRIYYHADGILKEVSEAEWRDKWYFRVRDMDKPYEINVDIDLANEDALTIFINYRVYDYDGRFIGATGVGLTVEAVRKMVNTYQERYQRRIFFLDRNGRVVLRADHEQETETDIRKLEGLSGIADRILGGRSGSYIYESGGDTRLLNVRFVDELNWYLCVEKTENEAISGIRRILILNLLICVVVTAVVLFASSLIINRFQSRLEALATTDKLTGLYNRQACDILISRLLLERKRKPGPLSAVLFDIDDFKAVNDTYGHLAGDGVLSEIARVTRARLRAADILCRWGGEEFLAILPDCGLADAGRLAEEIRVAIAAWSFAAGERTIRLTVSAGTAEFRPGETMDQFLSRADEALYASKKTGKNRTSTLA